MFWKKKKKTRSVLLRGSPLFSRLVDVPQAILPAVRAYITRRYTVVWKYLPTCNVSVQVEKKQTRSVANEESRPALPFFSRRIKQMRCELVKRKKKGNLLLYFILKRNDNTRETSVNYWEECHYNLRNAVMRGGQVSNEEIERKLPIEKTSRYCSDDAIIFVFFFSRAHKEGRICGLLHVFFLQKKKKV